ncbi:expressed unknown protein [Seminavis robusta]|uniref:Uncharacterized protein n=1 Tax=Seminavis robusta TaxID=568900 RepID=A0A9N8EGX7_9STRA|nr:expressed unknown protein [Seminavis robusta]|eukprot:Sro920_g220240.1 n/a (545) ;mRNA; f:20002-21636
MPSSFQPFVYVLLLGVSGLFLFGGFYSPERQPNRALLTPDPQPKVLAAKYDKPKPLQRTPFTLDSFRVHGINLAHYGLEQDHGNVPATILLTDYFRLYHDFALTTGGHLQGDEDWTTLLEFRKRLQHPGLAFYYDKIAQKRWLMAFGDIPVPQPYQLVYRDHDIAKDENKKSWIQQHLPKGRDYVAKPSHTAPDESGKGVWLVQTKKDISVNTKHSPQQAEKKNQMRGKNRNKNAKTQSHMEAHGSAIDDSERAVAEQLANHLHHEKRNPKNWARQQVQPGYIVEERIVSIIDDSRTDVIMHNNLPPMDFKVYVLWGRVFVASWSQGADDNSLIGRVYRNGTVVSSHNKQEHQPALGDDDEFPLDDPKKKVKSKESKGKPMPEAKKPKPVFYDRLPEWVNWAQILTLAEGLGQHKDMIRVDLLVGLPSDHPAWRQDRAAQIAATQVYVNAITLDPVGDELPDDMLKEAARLWVAGYKMGIFGRIPSASEVPPAYGDPSVEEVAEEFAGRMIFTNRMAVAHAKSAAARHPVWGSAMEIGGGRRRK